MTVLSVVGLLKPRSSPTALDHFWRPVLNESGSVLMCVGPDGDLRYFLRVLQQAASAGTPAKDTVDVSRSIDLQQTISPYMAFEDAVTLSRLVGFLQIKEKKYRIRNELSTTLADLRDGPVILIGAFNNDWTMRLTHQARFRFQKDPITRIGWIEDQQNPSRRDWQLDLKIPRSQQTDDYAIISRVMDPTTDRWLVIAAGEEAYGTMAAGEFLSDPAFMEAVAKQAPSNWERENIQIVLGTKVINGNSGPPRVLATYYW
jgi:hypothetical protein